MASSAIPLESPGGVAGVGPCRQDGRGTLLPLGYLRRRGFRPSSGCGHRSRRQPLILPPAPNCEVEPKMKCSPFAERSWRSSRRVWRGPGSSSRPCPGPVRRLPGDEPGCRCDAGQSRASRFQGRRRRRFRGWSAPRRGEEKGAAERDRWPGMPTYSVLQPSCHGWRGRGRHRGWWDGSCRGCRRRGRRRGAAVPGGRSRLAG